MDVINIQDQPAAGQVPLFLAIGNFDGVHRGHRALLGETVAQARAGGGAAAALTFEPHPSTVLGTGVAGGFITTFGEKALLMAGLGLERLIVKPFDREFAARPPERFIAETLTGDLGVRHLFVGYNYRFGRDRSGTPELLVRAGSNHGFSVTVIPPVVHDGSRISSTRVRLGILAGDLELVSTLLDRPYGLSGTIRSGRGVGRRLGFPTANLHAEGRVLPPPGVYRCVARIGRRTHRAVLFTGTGPTLQPAPAAALVEVHVPGVDLGDCAGLPMHVRFGRFIRAEQRFSSREELVDQIVKDIAAALPSGPDEHP